MRIAALILALTSFTTGAWACGPDTDCEIGDRIYRIAMPENHDGTTKVGAIVFSHGYRGSASGLMRNKNLRKTVSDMGLAFIALKSLDDDWVLPNSPRHMDSDGAEEFTYVDAVLDHATQNFAIDPTKMVASGFSAGGMMTWNLACNRPDKFAGFVPISGTFWLEPPSECAGPMVSIVHLHGDNDPTVPLNGRPILNTHQGKVSDALSMYAKLGGFGAPVESQVSDFRCATQRNDTGELLEFCLFEGGHSFRSRYLDFAWKRLEAAGQL